MLAYLCCIGNQLLLMNVVYTLCGKNTQHKNAFSIQKKRPKFAVFASPSFFRGHIKQCPIVELLLLMKLHVVAEFQKNGSETAEKVHWKKVNTRPITDWSLLRYTEGDHNQNANSQCHRPLI